MIMSVNKFKAGDVVKCVDAGRFNDLTLGKGYVLLDVSCDDGVKVENDEGSCFYYCPCRFELSNDNNSPQPPKFKEGDMVYLIGFGELKPYKLVSTGGDYLTVKFKVKVGDNFRTFTEQGYHTTLGVTSSIVLATDENRKMLNHLFGVEYEPVKLEGSELAKKLLKDKPQTCYVSDDSDEHAVSRNGVVLIMEFENDRFISKSGVGWKFAVPCEQHWKVLMDE